MFIVDVYIDATVVVCDALLLFLLLPIFEERMDLFYRQKSSIISLFAQQCSSIAMFNRMIEPCIRLMSLVPCYLYKSNTISCSIVLVGCFISHFIFNFPFHFFFLAFHSNLRDLQTNCQLTLS